MNIELLAADLASRVPDAAKDSTVNNVELFKRIIQQEIDRSKQAGNVYAIINEALDHTLLACAGWVRAMKMHAVESETIVAVDKHLFNFAVNSANEAEKLLQSVLRK